MSSRLEIVKSPIKLENTSTVINDDNVTPIVCITKIESPSSQISSDHKMTDFSIENLLRKDYNCEGKSSSSVIKLESVLVEEEADDCSPSISSSTGSSGAEEELRRVKKSGSGRRQVLLNSRKRRLHGDDNDEQLNQNLEEDKECQDDEVESFYRHLHHHRPDIPNLTNEQLSQSKYLSPEEKANLTSTFSWLTCTRFKPPKLPRSSKKRTGCKRYGRGPRIPFAPHQIAVLESTFSKSQYLSSDCIHRLADTLHLSETRVKIWFQNRRARYRREKEPQIGAAATIQLQQAQSHHQMRTNFVKNNQMMLSPNVLGGRNQNSPKHGNTSPLSSSGGSDIQTETDVHDGYSNGRTASRNQDPRRNLMPNFLSFQLHRQQQQQLQQYYLDQQQFTGSSSNQNGNNSGNLVSTSPLLHSALQPQQQPSPGHFSAPNASSPGIMTNIEDMVGSNNNYTITPQQQQHLHNLLCSSIPFPSSMTMPLQLSYNPVKYS